MHGMSLTDECRLCKKKGRWCGKSEGLAFLP
jgi:hypothetical protein